ncbi:sigma-70 family RNA polymerase sigma factor [Botrimarina hoheduenensis]|uniref:ECF RNA polymerase sigma factor SigK n=1 Tax=Botrimarina hoheduenensis TaxID=2528000 RepID=A0A5C5W9L4_9BACT|nr:sigma-70 family RNA polymerase sigma factor [Botrimarina hoheduenensis]TWT46885.1 ECF RNA polymerase sigma factor SigK [Botrimarina hoheduenensis]
MQDNTSDRPPDSSSAPLGDTQSGTPSNESVDQFVQLFAKHQRRVHAYIGAVLPSRNDADDVMQETSIALWRKWSSFDQSREFLPWACGVAHIEVLRHRRKYATQRVYFNENLMQDIAEEVLAQSEIAELRSEALVACLRRLNEADRQLVEQRYGGGVTALKAAEQLGRPPSTVYKALARIRRGLLDCVRRRISPELRG